jgi:hypothetical protein
VSTSSAAITHGRLLGQVRTGPDVELDAARAQVLRIVLALEADVAQQAGQQRQVQLIVGGRGFVQAPALFLDDGQQLRMHVAPFAQAQLRQEILRQCPAAGG